MHWRSGAPVYASKSEEVSWAGSPDSALQRPGATVAACITDEMLRVRSSVGEPVAPLPPRGLEVGDERLRVAMADALAGHEISYSSYADGVTTEVRVGPLQDQGGEVVGTFTVVAACRTGGGLQHKADECLRRLVNFSPAFVGLRDATGRIFYANPAFRHTFEEMADDSCLETIARAEVLSSVRTTERPRVWEGVVVQPDGHGVHLLGHQFPLPLPDGSIGTGEVYLDLSPQDAAHAERAASEQRYRVLFDSVGVGVLLLDIRGYIVDLNPAATRLIGRSRSEVRGRFLGAITSRAEIEAHRGTWESLMTGRRTRFDWPTTIRHAGGHLYHVNAVMTPIRDGVGRPDGAMVVVTANETDSIRADDGRRRVEVTAQQADVLERLAAGAGLGRIATDLGLTRRGIDYRVSQLRKRLRMPEDVSGRPTSASLVARAYAVGLMHPTRWPPTVIGVTDSDGSAH